MSTKALPRPRPCVITALELIGLEHPTVPEGMVRDAVGYVGAALADFAGTKPEEGHLVWSGRHVTHLAPIKPGGVWPYRSTRNVITLQRGFASVGLFVRGAIVLGDAMAARGVLLGRGVSRAERLRDEVAVYPRVILDPALLRDVEANPALRPAGRSGPEELGFIRKLVRRNGDAFWWADYLGTLVDDAPAFLGEHHRVLQRKLSAVTTLERDARDLAWLAAYHNDAVGAAVDGGWLDDKEAGALRIPATGPLLYTFPPSAKAP